MLDHNLTQLADDTRADSACGSSFEPVTLVLTLTLWTFAILYLLLLLIHYARSTQHFRLYDKCTNRNAHFRYDFHLIVGKTSLNFNRHEAHLILDLLDSQLISTITIQIPSTTIFNDYQVFVYKHSRPNLRCVSFTVYRRHPIKDVRCVRVAHSCNNQDSRLFVYGLNLYDATNGDNRFFPITSLVKNRGTQWALITTFEPKNDSSFRKLGVDCYDPFGYSSWPTYLEITTLLIYVWCSSFFFGYLIRVEEIGTNVALHSLTILFLVGSTTLVIAFVYLRLIKAHVVDLHYDSFWWHFAQYLLVLLVFSMSIALWVVALKQTNKCLDDTWNWLTSAVACAAILTILLVLVHKFWSRRRNSANKVALEETDAHLMKSNSKPNLSFPADVVNICGGIQVSSAQLQSSQKRVGSKTSKQSITIKSGNKVAAKTTSSQPKKKSHQEEAAKNNNEADETLDNAFGAGSSYMKTKNRNSISQYV